MNFIKNGVRNQNLGSFSLFARPKTPRILRKLSSIISLSRQLFLLFLRLILQNLPDAKELMIDYRTIVGPELFLLKQTAAGQTPVPSQLITVKR